MSPLSAHLEICVHTGIGRDSDTDLYQDRRTYVWDHHTDTATLSDDHGRIIDTASWGNDRHVPSWSDDRRGHDEREGRHEWREGRDEWREGGHHGHHRRAEAMN